MTYGVIKDDLYSVLSCVWDPENRGLSANLGNRSHKTPISHPGSRASHQTMWGTQHNHLLFRSIQLRRSPKAASCQLALYHCNSSGGDTGSIWEHRVSKRTQQAQGNRDLGRTAPFRRNSSLDFLWIISAEVVGESLLPLERLRAAESPSWPSHSWMQTESEILEAQRTNSCSTLGQVSV